MLLKLPNLQKKNNNNNSKETDKKKSKNLKKKKKTLDKAKATYPTPNVNSRSLR